AAGGGGAIANILSRTAVQPSRGLALSSMVRAGLAAWTKMLADEVGPQGVRVLGVLPGLTRTPHIEEGLRARGTEPGAGAIGAVPDAALEASAQAAARTEGVPLGRLGTPEALGRLVAFLVSPACDYVTGSLVRFDGGAIRAL
ncbi:MAG: SDR family oxidoreductase, partial [Firmicutes bacterium]|nr:SDR family oxidoreductase [Bacillota bacterium]